MKLLILLASIIVIYFIANSSGAIGTGSVRLFSEVTLSIIRVHTTRSKVANNQKSKQQAPDLYVYITAVAKRSNDTSDPGIEFFFAQTRIVKNTYKPIFNESFAYVRDPMVPYTLGTDNIFRVFLYDQAIGWGADESLGYFEIDLNQEATDSQERTPGTVIPERAGLIDYHGYRSTVTYKVDLTIYPKGSRTFGAMRDDEF